MDEYSISDYGIFSDAVTTSNTLKNNIQTSYDSFNTFKSQLSNQGIFMGPICDSCVGGFDRCNSLLTSLNENLTTISSYLMDTAIAYKNGDEAASNKVLNLKSGKLMVATGGASTGLKSGNENQDYVHDYLASQGFNEAAICGILANIKKETNFRSDIGGDYGTSYGMCGWHATRWDRLKDYCAQNNLDIKTIETQSQFLVWELQNHYPELYQQLLNTPNTAQGAYDAAHAFTLQFERPANMGEKAQQRGSIAMDEYWPFYTGTATQTT